MKAEVYKYTKTTHKPFTNSTDKLQIWSCAFCQPKQKNREWIFIHSSYGFISESPVAIEIMLETMYVSAIQPDQRASKWAYFLLNY